MSLKLVYIRVDGVATQPNGNAGVGSDPMSTDTDDSNTTSGGTDGVVVLNDLALARLRNFCDLTTDQLITRLRNYTDNTDHYYTGRWTLVEVGTTVLTTYYPSKFETALVQYLTELANAVGNYETLNDAVTGLVTDEGRTILHLNIGAYDTTKVLAEGIYYQGINGLLPNYTLNVFDSGSYFHRAYLPGVETPITIAVRQ